MCSSPSLVPTPMPWSSTSLVLILNALRLRSEHKRRKLQFVLPRRSLQATPSCLRSREKGRKEKLLQLHFVRQPFPFLSPFGDIFPRPGEVFLKEGASDEEEEFTVRPKPP